MRRRRSRFLLRRFPDDGRRAAGYVRPPRRDASGPGAPGGPRQRRPGVELHRPGARQGEAGRRRGARPAHHGGSGANRGEQQGDLLAERYTNIVVVTIAAPESSERAFSADTGMAEALIVATKRQDRNGSAEPTLFVNLRRRPASLLEAAETAQLAARLPKASASGRFRAGGQLLGTYIRAPLAEGGCAALREPALAETMIALRRGELRMPRRARRDAMPIAPLGELGERGLLDRDVGGVKEGKPPVPRTVPRRSHPRRSQLPHPVGARCGPRAHIDRGARQRGRGAARSRGARHRSLADGDAVTFYPRLPAQFAEPRRLPHSGARARRGAPGRTSGSTTRVGRSAWRCGPTARSD